MTKFESIHNLLFFYVGKIFSNAASQSEVIIFDSNIVMKDVDRL